MAKGRKYIRLEVFAIRSAGGGTWENDKLIDGTDYADCYAQAIEHMKEYKWAFETKITICDRKGDDFQ